MSEYSVAVKHCDPSVYWDRYLDGLHDEDAEKNFFDNDSEYRDDVQNHCEEVKCSFHRLDECGYTFIYSYDRDTKSRLIVDCVVTCELLRDGI